MPVLLILTTSLTPICSILQKSKWDRGIIRNWARQVVYPPNAKCETLPNRDTVKRTAPTSVTTSLPASKKTRHKATVQTMNAARSSSLLFAEHFNLHFPSSPTDVCGLQSETARKPELEKISASTAFAKPDITGGLDLQTVLPRIAEDSSVDLLEFLGDCVQFEE